MKISGIILAAGLGKRFGENKLLLKYENKTLLEIILNKALGLGLDEVIVVVGNESLKDISEKYAVKTVLNEDAHLGQSTSLRLGVKTAKEQNSFIFFVADQPLLLKEVVLDIIEHFEKNPEKIVVPVFSGKKGNPVIFPNKFRSQLIKATGDNGGRIIMENASDKLFLDFDIENQHNDIDTVIDYVELLKMDLTVNNIQYSDIIYVRGAGDIATGVIQKLHRSGFFVIASEVAKPTAIRRTVCLSGALYDDETIVEDITARRVGTINEIFECFKEKTVPIIVDPECAYVSILKPIAVVDAILAKKNIGTSIDMAPITVALGPGFEAGNDAKIVIETMRGHNLGRLFFEGAASPNTGEPGEINGFSKERVVYSPCGGTLKCVKKIGDTAAIGDVLAYVDETPVVAEIDGIVRGLLPDGFDAHAGMKMGDIDPRLEEHSNCFTISDKARALGGAALEAVLIQRRQLGIALEPPFVAP